VLRVVVGYGSGLGTVVVAGAALEPVPGTYAAPSPATAITTRSEQRRLVAAPSRPVNCTLQFELRVAAPFASPQSKSSNVTPRFRNAT
jgi:hypothetical protein